MSKLEVWSTYPPKPRKTFAVALQREREGWDGLAFPDSQNISGDPFIAICNAAAATEQLQLATGVTNPVTRHPAATATAAATLQAEVGDRVSLGIGRGDSSLAHLGVRPAPLGEMEWFLRSVQTYLRGDPLPLADASRGMSFVLDDDAMPHHERPRASQLRWLARYPRVPKVPVWVVASGPRMIQMAARHGDRVAIAVGADPARVQWAVGLARQVSPDVLISAYVNVLVDDDPRAAADQAAGRIAVFARFAAMHGQTYGPVSDSHRAAMLAVAQNYELTRHGLRSGRQSNQVTADLAETFAIIGPPGVCVERLLELHELGIDRFHIVGPGIEEPPGVHRLRFVEQVIPRLPR